MHFPRLTASCLLLAVAAAPSLHAQQVAPRLRESTPVDSPQVAPQLAPLPNVALGGVVGGALVGGAGAILGAALLASGNDDFVSSEAIGGVVGFALGYPVGVALGSRYAAAPPGHRPSAGRMVMTSAMTAALGGLIWYGTGRGADNWNPDGDNIDMWYIGAAAGTLFHLGTTSYMAWRDARKIRERSPAGQ
jgi:hypothetical protein